MRRTTRIAPIALIALFGLSLIAAACGGDNDGSRPAGTSGPAAEPSSDELGQPPAVSSDGPFTLESDDGLLRIEIPAGALPDGLDGAMLSATLVSGDAPEHQGPEGHGYYVIEPAGLELSAPATVTRIAASQPLAEELAAGQVRMLALVGAELDGSSPELLANHALRWDREVLSVRADVTRVTTLRALAVSNYIELIPASLAAPLGEAQEATVRLSLPFDAPRDIGAGLLDVTWQGAGALRVESQEQAVATITCDEDGSFTYSASGEAIPAAELLESALAGSAGFSEPVSGQGLSTYAFEVSGQATCGAGG